MKNSSPRRVERIPLKNKTVLLGVTGGAAAYKSIELVRRLREEGASVHVIMTGAAGQFVTPLSLQIASENRVLTSLFEEPLAHTRLPVMADLMVIAPATANIIAKFALGIADDLLSTCLLAYQGKTVIAPAMNWRMYENTTVRKNLRSLLSRGIIQAGPDEGPLACGEEGPGRMAEVADILDVVRAALSRKDLSGEHVLVTAGPTREYLDPVRFISNRSSGKMGYALARSARDRGAEVTLVSGPTALKRPPGMKYFEAETAAEMWQVVQKCVKNASVLIMTAAVADFMPARKSASKIDKKSGTHLPLQPTVDILSEVARMKKRPFVIGFAAETGGSTARAARKLKEKKMDMIVINDVTQPDAGFDVDTNRVIIMDSRGSVQSDCMPKTLIADLILDRFLSFKA